MSAVKLFVPRDAAALAVGADEVAAALQAECQRRGNEGDDFTVVGSIEPVDAPHWVLDGVLQVEVGVEPVQDRPNRSRSS